MDSVLPAMSSAGSSAGSSGLGLFGVATALQAGRVQAAAYKSQAQQYELSAKAEELKGRDQADKIRRNLQSTLASQNAAFGARGIGLGSGTVRSLATQSMSDASSDISRAQFGAGYNAESARIMGAESRIAARQARVQSYVGAGVSLFNTAKAAAGAGGF